MISTGALVIAHVRPEALEEMIRMVKPGRNNFIYNLYLGVHCNLFRFKANSWQLYQNACIQGANRVFCFAAYCYITSGSRCRLGTSCQVEQVWKFSAIPVRGTVDESVQANLTDTFLKQTPPRPTSGYLLMVLATKKYYIFSFILAYV